MLWRLAASAKRRSPNCVRESESSIQSSSRSFATSTPTASCTWRSVSVMTILSGSIANTQRSQYTGSSWRRPRSCMARLGGPGICVAGRAYRGVHGLHAGDRWTWKRPIVEGDAIRATRVLTKAELREGAYGGRSVLQVREFRFYDAADNLIATCEMSVVRAERTEARGRGKYTDVELGRYSLEELDAIDAEIDAEVPRGATPRLWDEVTKDEKLPAFVRGPLTIGDMLVWHMGAGGAAHVGTGRQWLDMRRHGRQRTIIDPRSNVPQGVQLVHMDAEIARYAAGMPAPYDIGAQRGAWTTVPFTNWIGDGGFLASMEVQYRSMNFLFDTTWWHVHVTDKWRSPIEPHGFVECGVEAVNQRGEVTLRGSAICVLPFRAGTPLAFPIDVSPGCGRSVALTGDDRWPVVVNDR